MIKSICTILVFLILCLSGCGVADDGGSVFVKEEPAKKGGIKVIEHKSGEWTPELTKAEKETLFAIAEDTLDWCVRGGRGDFFETHEYELTKKLKVDYATFVTLKEKGVLRGCIGSLKAVESLYMSVHNNAINASLKDFRFRPVTTKELERIDVHISILSEFTDIPSIDDFKLGEHGIVIQKGFNRAVYLPEVAVEQGWTKEETLNSLSRKAGMPEDAWKEGTTFKVYSSVVLERKEINNE
jgi:AmmeMemoRadiSam system protein A